MPTGVWSSEIVEILKALGSRTPRIFRTRNEIYAITLTIDAGLCTTSNDLTLSEHKVSDKFGLRPVEWAVYLTPTGKGEYQKLQATVI